jgi:hypothetical protein
MVKMYDISIDEPREVTDDDIDRFTLVGKRGFLITRLITILPLLTVSQLRNLLDETLGFLEPDVLKDYRDFQLRFWTPANEPKPAIVDAGGSEGTPPAPQT